MKRNNVIYFVFMMILPVIMYVTNVISADAAYISVVITMTGAEIVFGKYEKSNIHSDRINHPKN